MALRLPTQRLYATEGTNKDVLEWTCAEVVRHLKERTDPPVNQSLLDGFDVQEINGFALASVRPPTLFRMIKEQVEQGPSADKIEVSDQLLQDTLLGTATYSMQRR
ncbi:uncharacterized protein ACA1_398890 [Acanthamoeba castellanii str. Neff]|uniref:Uncharacterized protein n=1 Tax=Acanthamoeba castellanii (strain ATCC 30010 / Neff) TaxID=1257118 RepID=L8HDQ9_ACACF|nr:uncharacterized protein ACA1_398890 [Acanthamoeba castellanii str. Neff]ELR22903.1 hypothetical protein ACA1_398890 [Acanthamoeba castellanii str. Neff]